MKRTKLVCCAVLLAACVHRGAFTNEYAPMGRRLNEAEIRPSAAGRVSVPIADLIAFPERYHRSKVSVEGYVQFEFEGNTLCPGPKRSDWKACVWLDVEGLRDPGFRRARAVVEGQFDGENLGHLGIAGGAIQEISLVTRLK
jgi:hypothetical protein